MKFGYHSVRDVRVLPKGNLESSCREGEISRHMKEEDPCPLRCSCWRVCTVHTLENEYGALKSIFPHLGEVKGIHRTIVFTPPPSLNNLSVDRELL